MAELDIEKLMRLVGLEGNQKWFRQKYLTDASFYHMVNVAKAALEDRDRLRAALEQIVYGDKYGPQPNVWAESLRQIARAALEGRDG